MDLFEKVIALAKRRGFVFPSSEIYGGLANVWDFGPAGVLLKNNLRDLWWKHYVLDRDDMVGIDASTILKPEVWQASGHLAGFNEALVECRNCKNRSRVDHLIEGFLEDSKNQSKIGLLTGGLTIGGISKLTNKIIERVVKSKKVEGLSLEQLSEIIFLLGIVCPKCKKYDWVLVKDTNETKPNVRKFNQLVEVKLGTLEEGKNLAYLRGEIAQGIFLNFKNVINSTRVRIPFGIAQQGKAYRNEITMGQFVHRTLEFDLMEFEYFIKPEVWEDVFEDFRKDMWEWALSLGIKKENLRWREHEEFERSFYSKKTMDIEYKYPFGWKEMFGIAYRTDYDLKNHSEKSGEDLSFVDPVMNEKYIPHVVEPTFGLSRLVGILLFDAYHEEGERMVLKLNPKVAPYKVAIFPLLANKPELVEKARDIYHNLKKEDLSTTFDSRGNIGKRYFAQDEIGTPWCVTVDFQTLEDNTVTVRDRDTAKQERIKVDKLGDYFQNELSK